MLFRLDDFRLAVADRDGSATSATFPRDAHFESFSARAVTPGIPDFQFHWRWMSVPLACVTYDSKSRLVALP